MSDNLPYEPPPKKKKKRSGSETRQRERVISVRVYESEARDHRGQRRRRCPHSLRLSA